MIRSNQIRTLSAFAIAIMLPVAAFAATGTAKSSVTPAPKAAATNAMATTSTSHPAHMASKTKRAPAVDINSASKDDLMKLPGITDELAQKIIDARPYKAKTELTKKNVLTKAEYGKVRAHVIAKQEAKMGAAEGSKSEEANESKAAEAKENKTETGK
jgi:DNA uptake protein ComE-like DNA-binding protein